MEMAFSVHNKYATLFSSTNSLIASIYLYIYTGEMATDDIGEKRPISPKRTGELSDLI